MNQILFKLEHWRGIIGDYSLPVMIMGPHISLDSTCVLEIKCMLYYCQTVMWNSNTFFLRLWGNVPWESENGVWILQLVVILVSEVSEHSLPINWRNNG